MIGGDIHVGDVGTLYHLPTYDNDTDLVNFDPSESIVRQIIFQMPLPGGTTVILTRDADVNQVLIDNALVFCLEYRVVAADVVPGQFHQAAGKLLLQGYVEFSPDQKWKSNIINNDRKGRQFTISENL